MKSLALPSKARSKSVFLFTAMAMMVAYPAAAQIRPMGVPAAKAAKPPSVAKPATSEPDAPVPGNPDYAPDEGQTAEVAPAPPPLPPPVWDLMSMQQLLTYIHGIGADGLDPEDYDPEGLAAVLQTGDPLTVSAAATERFDRVSSDLALGHVKPAARTDWYGVDKDLDAAQQDTLLRGALVSHNIRGALDGLLPSHPQYAALKAALAATPETDAAKRDKIRLNLDRWRWLPRDLGQKYIIVNVPGFHATLVENGVNRWKQKAIAGKRSTPTPQLNATATGVILNPSWNVPKSIEKEAAGKRGFIPIRSDDGKRILYWRQPPGPSNALGQLKFVMPNSQAIYLHDTNARSRFNDSVRALSHGCIRTQHILDLATELLGDDGGTWTPERIKAALHSKKTVHASFVKSLPVYIVYFSQAALNDGRIIDYKDLYGRDPKATAALDMKDGGASLGKAKQQQAAPKPKAKTADQVATR